MAIERENGPGDEERATPCAPTAQARAVALPTDLTDLEPKAEAAAELLAAMANAKRLLVLCALMQGERQVGDLASLVGLNVSATSQHLARMRLQRLVGTRREGQAIFYRLESDEIRAILTTLHGAFCRTGD
jgi:DNA-binding transcriptional ArsR family regulator